MAEAGVPGGAVLIPVLLATLFKGRIVIDRFMALQGVGGAWRWVVLGWLLLVLRPDRLCFPTRANLTEETP